MEDTSWQTAEWEQLRGIHDATGLPPTPRQQQEVYERVQADLRQQASEQQQTADQHTADRIESLIEQLEHAEYEVSTQGDAIEELRIEAFDNGEKIDSLTNEIAELKAKNTNLERQTGEDAKIKRGLRCRIGEEISKNAAQAKALESAKKMTSIGRRTTITTFLSAQAEFAKALEESDKIQQETRR